MLLLIPLLLAPAGATTPTVTPLYLQSTERDDATKDASDGPTLLDEAKTVLKVGKNSIFAIGGLALAVVFGFLKGIFEKWIPGNIDDNIATILTVIGLGISGYGFWGFISDSRKAKETVKKASEPHAVSHPISKELSSDIANCLHNINNPNDLDSVFKISKKIVNFERSPLLANSSESLFELWSNPTIAGKLGLNNGDTEIAFKGGAGPNVEITSSDLRDLAILLAANVVANTDRNIDGTIVDGDFAKEEILDKIKLDEVEKGLAPHQHLYSRGATAVYEAARHYKEHFIGQNSFSNVFTPSLNDINNALAGNDATQKQNARGHLEVLQKHYNRLAVLKETIKFVIETEQKFSKKDISDLDEEDQTQYRTAKVLKAALIIGLELRAPVTTGPIPPGATNLSIDDQLTRILKGDASNTANLLGSNTGVEAKFDQTRAYFKQIKGVKHHTFPISESGDPGLSDTLGKVSLIEFK